MRGLPRSANYDTICQKNQPLSRDFRRVVISANLWYNNPVDAK